MSNLISSCPHKKVIPCIQVYKVKYNFDRLSIIKKLISLPKIMCSPMSSNVARPCSHGDEDNVDYVSAYRGEWVAPPSKDARNMMRPLFPSAV